MNKFFCDRCGEELPKEERVGAVIRVRGFSMLPNDTFEMDFHPNCLCEIIGADRYNQLVEEKKLRKKLKTSYLEGKIRFGNKEKEGGGE